MKFPGLYRKGANGIFQIRRRVPKDICKSYGKTEINRSLRTSDEAKAKQFYHQEAAKIEAEFNQCKYPADEETTQDPVNQSAKGRYD